MIDQARLKHPDGKFFVGSMFELPLADAAWSGAVSIYATLHAAANDRARSFAELRRDHARRLPPSQLLHLGADQVERSTYRLVRPRAASKTRRTKWIAAAST